jgi:cell division protein FtsI (penicillin-binding protein 3)/stage V sporulation protein D (sporulation-specific penicillin-binding protein)
MLGERGEIFLKNGESLAINMDWPFVFAHPQEIKDKEKAIEVLSEIFGLEENFLKEKFNGSEPYLLLKRKLSQEEVDEFGKVDMEGVYINKEKGRYYPQEKLVSQVVGFLDIEGMGQYGLEEFYNDVLTIEKGFIEEKKGSDLVLTIDYGIQFEAEKLLEQAKKDLKIENGEIIVVEPNSGRILAIASFLNFDPNHYEEYAKEGNLEIFKNMSTQAFFEPGSVFKPITMAAALEEKKISPKTTYTDEGIVKIGTYSIYNYDQRSYGMQTMTEVLEKSINTGAVFAQRQLGENLFLKYIDKFGFFEPTGIDIKENYPENKEIKNGREINFATASFGQGIAMTSIQLVRAYCAIANGGELLNPYLVEKVITQSGEVENSFHQSNVERIISSNTASQLTAMLVSVVENGFAKSAKIPGYFVAGKTGTAQVSYGALGIDKKGYSDKTIQTFIGFAPAFSPKFLVLIKLDNPETKTAEYSAVPIFNKLGEYIIHYYQIPPDYEE